MIDRIISKLDKIHDSLNLIQNSVPTSLEEFNQMGLIKDGIYKRLEYCVELLLDIVNIINSELKLGIPNGTQDLIQRMVKYDVIDGKTADLIKTMKSFRNILVHNYGEINDEIVYEILTEKLDDFNLISETIMGFLKKRDS